MSILDLLGALCSLLATYYFTKLYRCAWIMGLIATGLNITLYWQTKIYGHIFLEGLYALTMIFGIYFWYKPISSKPVIRSLTPKQIFSLSLMGFIGILLYGMALTVFTNSPIPFWDASTTVMSLIAQILLISKYIQTWALWFIVDAMIATLQWQQSLPYHALATLCYLSLAGVGYTRWQKIQQIENKKRLLILKKISLQ